MSLKLLDRIGRLVCADAHGVIEALEDDARLLKQHLRDAELALQGKRARLRSLEARSTELAESLERAQGDESSRESDVSLALEQRDDELARYAVRRLLEVRRRQAVRRTEFDELDTERTRLARQLAEQESAFEALRERVHTRLASLENAEPGGVAGCGGSTISDEEVELELLRRRAPSAPAGPA